MFLIRGTLSMIGVLGGPKPTLNLPLVVMRQVRLQGVTVGSNQDFAAMLQLMTAHGLKPVVDQVFTFAATIAAFQRMGGGQAFGKIVIDLTI
jgi:D-arabinose 1-dehydrogenase-like Zn-dependent alcohol dehydrogenase